LVPRLDVNQTLIEAIANAHRWQEQLESGECRTHEEADQG